MAISHAATWWEKPASEQKLVWSPEAPTLTIIQQFRLIEIAHETQHVRIRDLAMTLLDQVLYPKFIRERNP